MQYMLLIYQSDAEWEKLSEQEKAAIAPAYGQFARGIGQSGQLRGGNELKSASSATTVRIRNDKRVVTDGPFAETKEQLVIATRLQTRAPAKVIHSLVPGRRDQPRVRVCGRPVIRPLL